MHRCWPATATTTTTIVAARTATCQQTRLSMLEITIKELDFFTRRGRNHVLIRIRFLNKPCSIQASFSSQGFLSKQSIDFKKKIKSSSFVVIVCMLSTSVDHSCRRHHIVFTTTTNTSVTTTTTFFFK